MSARKRKARLVWVSLAMLLALSCRLLSDGIGGEAPVLATVSATSPPTSTTSPTETAIQAPPDTPTPVIVTVTDTSAPYPGPADTETPNLDTGSLTQTAQSLMQTLEAELETAVPTTPTPPTPTPSATLAYVPTITPTLPGLIRLTGLWYGYRKIEIQRRDCEESIFHNLRWRIFQDNNYNLLVNGDLSGYLKGNVVVLSGTEYFEGGTLDLTYILTVGPTVHRLSGYFYGKARLPNVCGGSKITQVNVPDGWIEVER